MKYNLCSILVLSLSCLLTSCYNPETIEHPDVQIARDIWGVPHIKGKTDADAVYGLAWAQCEDDFVTMQEQMLAAKGLLGEIKGKDGLVVDFAIKFMGLREEVEKRFDEINSEHLVLLQSFADAVNTFASVYPEEVLLDDAFPITPQDMLVGYQLGVSEISGLRPHLEKILNNNVEEEAPKGSNAIAISKSKTTNGKTFLAINSHQPLEGWYSWYEAHMYSDEGLNILGGTFPGGLMIFHGVNEHLGWAQTVNHPDFTDVYKLRMHETKKDHYYFDGAVLKLKKKRYWSWLKLWSFIKIPITQSIYESVYGPTFQTEEGTYALRFVASRDVRMSEQWFAMNKATSFDEFKKALAMQAIPCTNIVYADRDDNIFFISNARLPLRNPNYDWQGILRGDTSATLWEEKYYPIDSLPQVTNPKAGFVFNTNNSPFNATSPEEDPIPTELNKVLGFQDENISNNRSSQFLNLISKYDSLSYQDFKDIKFDSDYPPALITPYIDNLELILNLDPKNYPKIKNAVIELNTWNRETEIGNENAALFYFSYYALEKKLKAENNFVRHGTIDEEDCAVAITSAQKLMTDKYGSTKIPLGKIQRHIRGNVNIPLAGGPDVLAAMYWSEVENNQYKGVAGESYISLVQFSNHKVEIETINAYGSSAEPESPHYTDQMELFASRKLKPMTLDIEFAFASAETVYSPLLLK